MFSKAKTIAIIFLLVASLYVVVLVSSSINSRRGVEGFEDEQQQHQQAEQQPSKDDVDAAYASRKYVMTMFDSMFKRQPTTDEVDQYASFGTQKAILNAILSDYDKLDGPGVASKEPVVDPFDQQQPQQPAPTTTPAPAAAGTLAATYPLAVPATIAAAAPTVTTPSAIQQHQPAAPTVEEKLAAVEKAVKELRTVISSTPFR